MLRNVDNLDATLSAEKFICKDNRRLSFEDTVYKVFLVDAAKRARACHGGFFKSKRAG